MLVQSVRIEGSRVIKRYPSEGAADAALERAETLRAAGLKTPPANRIVPAALAFPRLQGRSGAALVADLATLLSPLSALHHTPVRGLVRHDPFRRIAPRLPNAPPPLRDRIQVLEATPKPSPSATLHGDFHPGQVIVDDSGSAWLIDLDDMALGPPEADLGNLLAYLLTAPATRDDQPEGGWYRALIAAWTGLELRPATFCLYAEIALIRRVLKLADRDDHAPLSRLMSGGYRDAISGG